MEIERKIKVLFFANIPVSNEERSIGGATVLAKNILDFIVLDSRVAITHQQIRTFWRNKLQLIDYFFWVFRFPFVAKKFDVISFHGTKDFHFTIAPILWLWAKALNRKTIYHFFGGNFMDQYEAMPKAFQFILKKTVLKSDTVFFETQQLMIYFENKNVKNAEWLPNARKPIQKKNIETTFEKKFVFISRVIPQKGITEIVKAAAILPDDYSIDVYGPIDDRHYENSVFKSSSVNYKGILRTDEIEDTLSKYNVLLLPSYFEGEGYPGIIIESLAMGIPVIATQWKALPEVIMDGYNGLLVPIKDSEALAQAMRKFNQINYPEYCKNALESFEKFNSEIVFNRIIESYIKE
ncbi:glycosyltransferase [Galbibacter sp.]|uniref:glycosyltransferase n=1 Tax=Galbibacter sp. TaxID=2918471 RepID=UPI003A8EC478